MIPPQRSRLAAALVLSLIVPLAAACHRRMAPPKPYLALVANRAGKSVAVVNLSHFDVTRVIPLGFAPAKIAQRPAHPEVFVTSLTGQVAVIHFPELTLAGSFQTGRGPNQLVFTRGGGAAYVLGGGGRTIFKIDCGSLRALAAFHLASPLSSIALDSHRNTLLGKDSAEGTLVFIDAKNGKIKGSVETGKGVGSIVVTADGGKAFVAAAGADEVTAVDLAREQILSRIDVGSRPSLLVLKPDGGELFALSGPDSTMTILNVSYDSVEESHPSGADPVAAVFTRDSRWLYIANAGDGAVTRFDVQNRRDFPVHVGITPQALALTPDERFLAVADSAAGRLTVIRAATGDLMTSIPVGANPVDVVIPGWIGKR
ncbi:MAG: YncE family protein [Terriglobia bacterium]